VIGVIGQSMLADLFCAGWSLNKQIRVCQTLSNAAKPEVDAIIDVTKSRVDANTRVQELDAHVN
jgi:hypothetical protein